MEERQITPIEVVLARVEGETPVLRYLNPEPLQGVPHSGAVGIKATCTSSSHLPQPPVAVLHLP